jgi:hypothetical protein
MKENVPLILMERTHVIGSCLDDSDKTLLTFGSYFRVLNGKMFCKLDIYGHVSEKSKMTLSCLNKTDISEISKRQIKLYVFYIFEYTYFLQRSTHCMHKIIHVWTLTILWYKIKCIFKYSDYTKIRIWSQGAIGSSCSTNDTRHKYIYRISSNTIFMLWLKILFNLNMISNHYLFIIPSVHCMHKIIHVWTLTILWYKIKCIFKYSDYFSWLTSLIFTGTP